MGDGAIGSHLWLSWGKRPPVLFLFRDRLRPDAGDTVNALRKRGIAIEMLSGDQSLAANEIAVEAGISNWFAEVTPQDKIARLRTLREQGRKVLMIGDELNDAPALAQAHASISFGNAAEASQSAADLILQGENLLPIVESLDVARAARQRVLENFALSAAYNLFAIPVAVLGFVTPLIAALAMSGSSLAVTLNALRFARPGGEMNILGLLIPVALGLASCGLLCFLWTLRTKQYEDLEGAAARILFDDEVEGPSNSDGPNR